MAYDENNLNKDILHPKLSYDLQGAFYEVANTIGKGMKEKVYQNALAEELEAKGIPHEQQKRIAIYSPKSGDKLGVYVPDFLVDDTIIVEIKATDYTPKQARKQHFSYLKASEYEVGYLVNFCTPELYIERSIYTNDRKPFIKKLRGKDTD